MQNELAKYVNNDNLATKVVKSCNIVQGTARESGNIYYAVEIEFINGYKKRIFPQDAEKFAIASAFELAQANQQVDAGSVNPSVTSI